MKRYYILFILCLLAQTLFGASTQEDWKSPLQIGQENHYDFTDSVQNGTLIRKAFQGRWIPQISNDNLMLMNGGRARNQNNAVIFPDLIDGQAEIEHYSFVMHITRGAEGAGFALLNTNFIVDDSLSFRADSWEQPNFPYSFGLGIDVHNPQSSHWFDEWGNFYGREEREISFHWNNREIHKLMSPIEFRATPMGSETNRFDLTIHYVTAGALINLAINDTLIVTDFFIPEMVQYAKRPVFGASTGVLTTTVILTEFGFKTKGNAPLFKHIGHTVLLQDEVFYAYRRNVYVPVQFPDIFDNINKVIMTLDLCGPEGGVSDWDVSAAVHLVDADSVRYEILRYITPYRRPALWKVDVTDFLPLFRGNKTVHGFVSTWEPKKENPAEQRGWKVTATLDFYQDIDGVGERLAPPRLRPYSVQNLWQGNFVYGDIRNPLILQLEDFNIKIPEGIRGAKLRVVTTGHGMYPNHENAAEFRPADRWVVINGDKFHNLLWTTDCYLNPIRPQDGTWKFDRAGWRPGDVVIPWEICLNKYLGVADVLNISYLPDDYVNINQGDTWGPYHKIEAQIIFYR